MGLRFRKSVKLFPGVRLNISARGVSTTIGGRGASVNFSNRGTYVNVGIPGTGLSYRTRIDQPKQQPQSVEIKQNIAPTVPQYETVPALPPVTRLPSLPLPGEITSADTETITSSGLRSLKSLIREVIDGRATAEKELQQVEIMLQEAEPRLVKMQKSLITRYLFTPKLKKFKTFVDGANECADELRDELASYTLDVDMNLDVAFIGVYEVLKQAFIRVSQSHKIWDTTSSVHVDTFTTRSAAANHVTRQQVDFHITKTELITSAYEALHLENANGGDIYIYPGFVLVMHSHDDFALVDFKDITLSYMEQRFVEDEMVPTDSTIIGQTWEKVNKDGSPDRRFAGNKQLPIAQYGKWAFTSSAGLNEEYQFSNCAAAMAFGDTFTKYQSLFR